MSFCFSRRFAAALALFAAAAAGFGCAAAPGAQESRMPIVYPTEVWQTASPESQGLDPQRVAQAIEHLRKVCGEDGVSEVMLIKNGYVVWQGDQTDRRHPVWSVSKSFTSTCLGLLWDDGLCSPATVAAQHIPALSENYPDVTLEHLGTFTGGYGHQESSPLVPGKPNYPPGTAFHYSAETDLLAGVLTVVAGKPLKQLFFERIGEPIGITPQDMDWGTVGEIDGLIVNCGSGLRGEGVKITAEALARFGWLMCNDGVWDGKRLISERYLDFATVARTDPDLPPFDADAWYVDLPGNYGLNWWTNGVKPNGQRRWPSAPVRTFAAQGNHNNNCFIIPSWNLVLVRTGTDKIISMDEYDRVFELLDPAKQ